VVLVCASCGRAIEPGDRFCDACGEAMTATAATPPEDVTAVRKTVTVLFCDLVGSTPFAESVDQESARTVMGEYHAMARAVVEAHGGTLSKFIGDGVMAVFGVPEVAEDDADRAVATGEALQLGFESIRVGVATRRGIELAMRVGINTGEVACGDGDADLVGDVPNTAARLESECPPGAVVVGESTWRLTRGTRRYEALGEVEVKGKRLGVPVFRLVFDADESDVVAHLEPPAPFIGRNDELSSLLGLLDVAVASGEARMATVIGSPGVGKTRLARALAAAVADVAEVFDIRCERSGTATFEPVIDLLRQISAFDDGDTAEQITAALGTLTAGAPDRARLIDLLGGFVGTAAPRSTEDAFFAVRRLLEIAAGRRPVVVVIDDIQWAEPLLLDLLEHLVEWIRTAPVLIVALARPELREIRPALTESGRRVALVIPLEGLDAAATEQLATELLGGSGLPAQLIATLPSSTGGNPLFVRELVRMLVDDGVVTRGDDRWLLAVDLDGVEVPPTIQSLLATRVERLPVDERRVLELASVIGPEFPLGALASLLPEMTGSQLSATIERLRRKEQVEPTGTYWGDEPIVRFHHVLIRDAAYRRLLKHARADLHLRVATWMQETTGGVVGEVDVTIAFHVEQAYRYRRQLDDLDEATVAVGRRAADLLQVAAERALERDDLAAAAGLSRRALDCLADDADSLAEVLVLACEASLSSGDVSNGRTLLERLSEVAQHDDRLRSWSECFDAQLAVLTDPTGLERAAQQAEAAATVFDGVGDAVGLAKAHIVHAGALARLGRVGACKVELDRALTAARTAGDRRRMTAVLSAAPVAALWGPSPVTRAGGRCLDVVRLSRITADSPAVEAHLDTLPGGAGGDAWPFRHIPLAARERPCDRRGDWPAARPAGDGAVLGHRRAARR
jgi:class 3 adenylate cyclase